MFNNMQMEDSKFGRAFFLCFVLVMLFLMTNMLISILTEAMATVKREMRSRISKHEFMAFLGEKISDLVGIESIASWAKG